MKKLLILVLGCMLVLSGCGGGGGGGAAGTTYSTADLEGGWKFTWSSTPGDNSQLLFDNTGFLEWDDDVDIASGNCTVNNDGTFTCNGLLESGQSIVITGTMAADKTALSGTFSINGTSIGPCSAVNAAAYRVTVFSDYAVQTPAVSTAIEVAMFNSDNTLVVSEVIDTSGVLDNFETTYTDNGDGTISTGNGNTVYQSVDKKVFGFTYDAATENDYFLGVMAASGMSNATLAGEYEMHIFGYELVGGFPFTAKHTYTVNGDGTGTYDSFELSDATSGAPGTAVTYTVDYTGAATFIGPFGAMNGFIAEGGQFGIFNDTDASDNVLAIAVVVKKGAGVGPSGEYWGFHLGDEEFLSTPGGVRNLSTFSININANSTFDATNVENSSDFVNGVPYTFNSSTGNFDINGINAFEGGTVAPDGSVIIYTDRDSSDGSVDISFWIKK